MENFVKNNKKQLFQIGEIERAMRILFDEIQERFSNENKIGMSIVERLAVNVGKMVKELRKNATEYQVDDLVDTCIGLLKDQQRFVGK